MADGYGFAAEGDWKTAALVRALKVMSAGLSGGTSFMEDYTYHLHPDGQTVLGAHMLEICPSIAAGRPTVEIHPLGIGGKADPVRLVFDARTGPAVNASIVEMGDRYRMIVNVVDVVATDEPLPKLPVARALWRPRPDLATAAAAWIYARQRRIYRAQLRSLRGAISRLRAIAGVELLLIDEAAICTPLGKRGGTMSTTSWRADSERRLSVRREKRRST